MRIAVVGATGAVGRQMLCELESLNLSNVEFGLYASARSAGQALDVSGRVYPVYDVATACEHGSWDYVLMSAGSAIAQEYAAMFADKGAVVIDNSSAFREGELLVVPEVNADLLQEVGGGQVIANPNCSTIQMVVCLAPLQKAFGLKSVCVSTYQAVSGAGAKGQRALQAELEGGQKASVFPRRIAGNVIPWIGDVDDQGHCEEELKMVNETRKIMRHPSLEVQVMTVRVPVANGHSEAVFVELEQEVTRDQVLEVFAAQEGLILCDAEQTPDPLQVSSCAEVFVGRVRLPHQKKTSKFVQFWNVADNLRKGAATNAVQILTKLLDLS